MKTFIHHGFGYPVSLQANADGTVTPSTHAISGEVLHAGWISPQLVAASLVLVVVLSLAFGTVSSRWRNGPVDVGVRLLSYSSWSIPTFLIAFFFRRWFTGDQTASAFVYGPQTIGYHGEPTFFIGPPTGGFVDWFRHMTCLRSRSRSGSGSGSSAPTAGTCDRRCSCPSDSPTRSSREPRA